MGARGSSRAESNLAVGHDQDLDRANHRLGVPGECDRLLHQGNRKLELSDRCRPEEALDAVEQAVLARLPEGSRNASVTLTTDNGTQFTATRFIETLNRLGITHRRTGL
jgi:hypothetical protein